MTVSIPKLLRHYTTVLWSAGRSSPRRCSSGISDWIDQPVATMLLIVSIFVLRSVPVRLSKYSYLTQSGIPTLVGAVCVGPRAGGRGALGRAWSRADVFGLRKQPRAGLVNAGREVIGFVAAFGPYAAILALNGTTELTVDFLPAAAILVSLYFFISRALFYFSLLIRDKLESAEKILILRWEISSYLLTLIGATVVVAALATLAPVGWVAAALALGVLGLLTRQILDEAIGAEDLNKVHLMEAAIASNATLQGSFTQIERLAYRLLDWGDFRVYRVIRRRRVAGLPQLARPAEPERAGSPRSLRCAVRRSRSREPVVVRDVTGGRSAERRHCTTSGCW